MSHLINAAATALLTAVVATASAQQPTDSLKPPAEQRVKGVTVRARRPGQLRLQGVENGTTISRTELFRAACCNLGESFTTNPSVDVSYNDAATGAKQIKLLGLSGTYVQMLAENIPDFRIAAMPFALSYVPGPWMKSIQVSKGCSSVKNGYESITGQIDVEYLKPEDKQEASFNVYGNTMGRLEANAVGNAHLSKKLSANVLAHFENEWGHHDGNDDGFYDSPQTRQYNLQNRWHYNGGRYIFHGGMGLLDEYRRSGQLPHSVEHGSERFGIGLQTDRYHAYMKHAYIIDPATQTNVALMAQGTMHTLDALYGHKSYYVNQKNLYTQLVLETTLAEHHSLSAGFSLNYDYLGQRYRLAADGDNTRDHERETVPGAHLQYTLNLHKKLVAMAGVRVDHSSVYGTFFTPRFHLKLEPSSRVSLRLSAGKGFRTVHALAENNNLLSSGRRLVIGKLPQEEAWNYGISGALNLPIGSHLLKINAEYYYTDFINQAVVDYDTDPTAIKISPLDGRSYSHTVQIDATYPFFKGFTLTAAWRLNDVQTTIDHRRTPRPLTPKYKALLTASYKTPLELWQFDATLQLNGGGHMPRPYTMADGSQSWNSHFKAYPQLSAQVTRWFRHFSVYLGGENLTNFKQKHPIVAANRPWSGEFEPTLVWGPVQGAMVYAGVRLNIGRK